MLKRFPSLSCIFMLVTKTQGYFLGCHGLLIRPGQFGWLPCETYLSSCKGIPAGTVFFFSLVSQFLLCSRKTYLYVLLRKHNAKPKGGVAEGKPLQASYTLGQKVITSVNGHLPDVDKGVPGFGKKSTSLYKTVKTARIVTLRPGSRLGEVEKKSKAAQNSAASWMKQFRNTCKLLAQDNASLSR